MKKNRKREQLKAIANKLIYSEQQKNKFDAKGFAELFMTVKTKPWPDGTICRFCGSTEGTLTRSFMSGPYGGRICCSGCGRGESVMNYFGHSMFTVTPMFEHQEGT